MFHEEVDDLAGRVSGVRDLSNDIVGFFDDIDDLRVDIPLLGSVSAMDVIRESFAGIDEAETIMRSLASDLNVLNANAEVLFTTSTRIPDLDLASISGDEVMAMFGGTVSAANALDANAESARGLIDGAEQIVAELEGGPPSGIGHSDRWRNTRRFHAVDWTDRIGPVEPFQPTQRNRFGARIGCRGLGNRR